MSAAKTPILWKARHIDGRETVVSGVRWYDARAAACVKLVCLITDVHVSQLRYFTCNVCGGNGEAPRFGWQFPDGRACDACSGSGKVYETVIESPRP